MPWLYVREAGGEFDEHASAVRVVALVIPGLAETHVRGSLASPESEP